MAPSSRLVFVTLLVVNCVLWSQSRYAQLGPSTPSVFSGRQALHRRGIPALVEAYYQDGENQCRPLAFPVEDQCAHVSESCATSDTFLSIPYLHSYFCTASTARPVVFVGLVLWLIFLFSTLGISASDFFCPNLATIAQLLGLDENVAGVTFLAFGNGSPDVFSTFSALRADSGSLAIGELLGAASFIVSCVVGSMCIIKPFRINRGPFLRDIGFFTTAVVMLLVILIDGNIHTWEALLLVALYVVYVVTVVVGSWWDRRRERKRWFEARIRSEYADDDEPATYFEDEPYRDDPAAHTASPDLLVLPTPHGRPRASSHPGPPRLDVQTNLSRSYSHARSGSESNERSVSIPHTPITHLPSFSLVGALEFRNVVASLQNQAAGSGLNVFDSPLAPYPGGHYHGHASRSRSPTPRGLDDELNPWDSALGGVPLDERTNVPSTPQTFGDTEASRTPIPAIVHTPASPTLIETLENSPVQSKRRQVFSAMREAWHILFPTFHGFACKSVSGMIAAILAAPAVLALTLTLPVIVKPYDSAASHHEKAFTSQDPLIQFEEEGAERALLAEEGVAEEMHANPLVFNKWLMSAQCILGPLFCAAVLFKGTGYLWLSVLVAGVIGLVTGVLIVMFATDGEHKLSHVARCSMGFFVAMVWIMAIADEVVNVLQTFGFIFGLSDAIIGLTIFAVGNSLADLVANMSVAVFAPIMGFSACFGGPMLNMLLGVGISGSYITSQTGVPYHLHFTTTLLVSAVGLLALLLATAIFVPLNGYYLPRAWGIFLIAAYAVLMTVNIVVEILSE